MSSHEYPFMERLGRAIKSGASRALVVSGNVQDLFRLEWEGATTYVPLVDFLAKRCDLAGFIPVIYELNGPIRFLHDVDRQKVRAAWVAFQETPEYHEDRIGRFIAGKRIASDDVGNEFDKGLDDASSNATLALEMLRWMCECSRTVRDGKPLLDEQLIVIVEGADFMVPEGQIAQLSDANLRRVAICRDWFSDPGFIAANDTVVFVAESRSLLHHRIARMPQVLEVAIPSPDTAERLAFIEWFCASLAEEHRPTFWGTAEDLANAAAALTIHALRQMLLGAAHDRRPLGIRDVTAHVEVFIQQQLGEDVVEFKHVEHTFANVIGCRDAKAFIEAEVLPGLRLTTKDALASIIVCGAIGVGKTFLWEAVAAAVGIPVLVLKNIRSKWFGETDVIFERLRRVLEALSKVLIYVNEADTAFGGVGKDSHETERRLTGKLQAMMADSRLRGKVHWLLDTARAHLLSEDLRRPGRGGDLIFGMFDPEGEDRTDFIRWTVDSVLDGALDDATLSVIDAATIGYYAGAFGSLRAELRRKANALGRALTVNEMLAIVRDITPADIGLMRRYQTLQALLNCTRKSLRPAEFRTLEGEAWNQQMTGWYREVADLESAGIS